jgi:hypothetical protein
MIRQMPLHAVDQINLGTLKTNVRSICNRPCCLETDYIQALLRAALKKSVKPSLRSYELRRAKISCAKRH